LFGLKEQGAVLIPDLKYFRAHHNKVFMEVLRDISSNQSIRNIKSFGFGTFEDYLKFFNYSGVYVLKSSDTSKSKGVYLIKNYLDTSKVKKLSKTFSFQNLRYLYRSVRKFKKHLFISNYRKKFILQEYIPNLSGDYRVIVYGNKYYVLYRKNRINDFRASGSMRFYFGTSLPDGLLNFSKEVFQSFHVPFIALDIGEKNGAFYLFEFQAVSFGQYTFEKSSGYYFKQGESWVFKKEKPDLESEFVTSIVKYLKDNNI
jgi:glutathione synthase/RimK-type ligase-like ATP-grasp enzyme